MTNSDKSAALSGVAVDRLVIRRFPGNWRRYGTNWTVFMGDAMAADSAGNVWCFRTRKQAQKYLDSGNVPAQFVAG